MSTFKAKIHAFVDKHGYTWRSYVLSILLFPPAAVFIACRKPGLTLPGRIVMNVLAVGLPPFITAASLYTLKLGVDLVAQWT